ncbi:MAG: hypothetical protein GY859_40160, partial [Desulfobacterales bacterium]|nr:hypothetical protein [Desulfobacterales bacterium]
MPVIVKSHGENLVNMAAIIRPLGRKMVRSESLAREIRGRYASIFPLLDELCAVTCPWCPDICCARAFVWFDLKDLLFLHFIGRPAPAAQPRPTPAGVCRHLGARGCRLPRIARPWICTWYLCPTQKGALKKKGPGAQRAVETAIREIKKARKAMAEEFHEA